jgi:hypothetical protein
MKWQHNIAIAAILIFSVCAAAQIAGTGAIQGVIADNSGAVIPGATVTVTDTQRGVKTERQATSAGFYNISPLPPGEYSVAVSAQGFENLTREHLRVDALQVVGLNLTLQVGAASQSIVVSDVLPLLNTADARMGQTMRNEQYTALPLAMGNAPRDPTAFTQYMPGVNINSTTGNTAGNVLGGQDHSQEVYVEGLAVTNPVLQGETRTLGLGVSVEAVDQFQLETAGTAAMYSGQGAANFVLKSGTNNFHGAAYEYFRNTQLDARSFFSPRRTAEHQNEFGFSVGGPIKRNKLFFFANYDGFRFATQPLASLMTIPTLAERNGDFGAFPNLIYDPATTDCSRAPCTRQPFAGNVIPASRLSAISRYFESFLPNPTNNAIQTNYLGTVPVGYTDNSTTAKVDYALNERNTFYVLFSHGHRSQTTPYRGNTLPLPYASTRLVNEIPYTAQAKYTRVISASMLNQLSYGFSRFGGPITNATIAGNYPVKAGLTGLPAGEAAGSFPEISWTGPNPPDGWRANGGARAFNDITNTFVLQDAFQWTRGKHALTFGGQIQWLQINEKQRTYGSLATWNFSNSQTATFTSTGTLNNTTGNPYASYLLGAVNTANVVQDSVVATGGRFRDYSWWVQDNYKPFARLSVSLGLRHDIWLPYVEVLDRESYFDPAFPNPAEGGYPGALRFYGSGPNSCNCRSNVNVHYGNFGPRIGLAWNFTDRTVIRAGYAIMYAHRGGVGGRLGGRFGTDVLGYTASPVFNTADSGISPAFYWDNGVPPYQQPPIFDPGFGSGFNGTGAAASTITFGDPQIGGKPPMYQNWNIAVERAVTNTITISTAWVGSNGHWLGAAGRGIWSDQIDPKYLALGNLLQQQATASNIAAANAVVPGIGLPFPSFSGSIAQMLRPFPQYNGISDEWGDVGNSNYNSLQIAASKRLSRGLSFNFNYTWAKAFDDTAGTRTAYNLKIEKARTAIPPHTVNFLWVYDLPFGQGKRVNLYNRMINAIAGNWQLSGITTYRDGAPISTIVGACNLPQAGTCYASYRPGYTGDPRINGSYGSGNLLGSNTTAFLDANAFVSTAAYTYGNTPRTGAFGLSNPSFWNQDLSLKRKFPIRENIALLFQMDAFNVFNAVMFSPFGTPGTPSPALNITSASFGKITSQANSPRALQLSARVVF